MKYPYILSAMSQTSWAINRDALRGLVAGVRGELTDADRGLFHAADPVEFQALVADLGDPVAGTEYTTIRGNVGVLQVNGPLVPRASAFLRSSGMVSTDMLAGEFAALDAEPLVKTIVMIYDTPGGAVTGISDFASMIKASSKRVIAFVAGRASSGGYWLASPADEIISVDTGLVGSIGVVSTVCVDKDNSTVEIVSDQSPKKRLDYSTQEGRDELKATVVNDLAAVFVRTVAENRGVDESVVLSDFGQGGERVAGAALAAGMIDRISTLAGLMNELSGEGAPSGSVAEPVASNRGEHDLEIRDQKKGAEIMDLKEMMKSDPAVAREVDGLKEAAKVEGFGAMQSIAKQVAPYLVSADYPETIKGMGAQVLEGAIDVGVFLGAVAGYDAVKASGDVDAAATKTAALGETPGQGGEGVSSDGIVRTPDDYTVTIARLRSLRGIVEKEGV